jgi:hypothetical protein
MEEQSNPKRSSEEIMRHILSDVFKDMNDRYGLADLESNESKEAEDSQE